MRRLIIDGNAVYEIDENCMLKREVKKEHTEERQETGHASKEGKKS